MICATENRVRKKISCHSLRACFEVEVDFMKVCLYRNLNQNDNEAILCGGGNIGSGRK